jgi:hypothetical protein
MDLTSSPSRSADRRDRDGVRVIRNHRRFALTDVTLDAAPVGGATVDVWHDAAGVSRWLARVLMPLIDTASGAELAGRAGDGRRWRGRVALVGAGPSVRNRGPVLMEWRGVGPIRPDDAD